MRRLLKKEVSLDTYTWQKKYGHLTSSVMMAQVDERLKRRFSVSASMEEISKIAEMKTLQSQASLGPEQAALAQSQHFDQLEALWNKRSPPRRRNNAVRVQIKFIANFFKCFWFICIGLETACFKFNAYDGVFLFFFSFLPQSLSRQTSLVEDRIDDSDEDEFQEERSGMYDKLKIV